MVERARSTRKKSVKSEQAMTRGGEKQRPPLTPETSIEDFRNYYWYANELAAFCRRHGLPTSGQKHELVARIEEFLKTGRRAPAPKRMGARKKSASVARSGPITFDTVVGDDFKCDAETREFFKSAIGDYFHFTAHLQQFRRERMRDGVQTTYGDLVREWLAERERRKTPNYKSRIGRYWQYNQFVRDFMGDKQRNAGKGMSDAARAWNIIRAHSGPHNYEEYLRLGHE